MTWLLKTAAMIMAIYAFVVLAAWLGQRRLMYVPDTARILPASAGLDNVAEQELTTPDGTRLIAWRVEPRDGRPMLLYFHGNAGGLASRADRIARYRAAGLGVFMISYRGYSGSSGSPSEANNLADARLAYDTLLNSGSKPSDIVLYGESLGSGIAIQLAAERPVAAVVLDAPYTSIVEVAALAYPFLPVRPLLIDRYESVRHIRRMMAPLLVLHGSLDGIIPVAMGRALYAAANEPKRLIIFPDGGHSDLDDHGAVDAVRRWLSEIVVPGLR